MLLPKNIFNTQGKMYDSNEQLNHNSWTIGGTHITNFDIKDIVSYKEAIEQYKAIKPNVNLVISGFAYDCNGNALPYCSLHFIGDCGDLGDFWDIQKGIKEGIIK